MRIVIERSDGSEMTLYPKDAATKARWIAGYTRKGVKIVSQ